MIRGSTSFTYLGHERHLHQKVWRGLLVIYQIGSPCMSHAIARARIFKPDDCCLSTMDQGEAERIGSSTEPATQVHTPRQGHDSTAKGARQEAESEQRTESEQRVKRE
jgi:hypothetical protein